MTKIIKRDGRNEVEFEEEKIVSAIGKAMEETDRGVDLTVSLKIAKAIRKEVESSEERVGVEYIQDRVEELLAINGRFDVSKRYVLYRNERDIARVKPSKYKYLSDSFLKKYRAKKDSFNTELGKVVYKRTYARPVPEENRREDWWETVARVVNYSTELEIQARSRQGQNITQVKYEELIETAKKMYDHMFNLGLFPSGRSLWIGGSKSAYAYKLANFNCSFITINEFDKFSEMFQVLMLGTGVGLSVEKKYIERLPKVNTDIRIIHENYQQVASNDRLEYTELRQTSKNVIKITVGDSKFGR